MNNKETLINKQALEAVARRRALEEFFTGAGNRAGALASGVVNIPLDIGRYASLANDWFGAHGRGDSPEVTQQAYDKTNQFWDAPSFFSDDLNRKRQQLQRDHPNWTAAGEIIGSGVGAGALVKKSLNLAKGGRIKGATQYQSRVPDFMGMNFRTRNQAMGAGAATAAVHEFGTERVLNDAVFNAKEENEIAILREKAARAARAAIAQKYDDLRLAP